MITVIPGIFDISNEDYHATHGISRTGIMKFKETPAHYYHSYVSEHKKEKEPTPEMILGTALHTIMLEPNTFDDRYVVPDKIDRRSNAGKADYAEMIKKNQGKTILSQDDYNKAISMRAMIEKDFHATQLIAGGNIEKSFFWIDPETQLICKARPDVWHEGFIVDYKSCDNASPYKFQKALYDLGYYMQCAMIYEAFKHVLNKEMRNFLFLAQEKKEPYLHAIYQLDPAALEYGIEEFHKLLYHIKECIDSNRWPGYKTQMIGLPAYASAR